MPIEHSRHEPAQRRDHRPCRPRQDHPGRPAAAAVGLVPREPARRRARDGLQRPRTRARHHDPRQGDLDRVEGHPDQHRRYARPRRFRRRGRAHPQHGGRRHRARRCRRGAAAADQVRGLEGAQGRASADRRHQQGATAPTPARRWSRARCSTCSRRSTPPRNSSISRCSTARPRKAGWRRASTAPRSRWRRCSISFSRTWRRRRWRTARSACSEPSSRPIPISAASSPGESPSGSVRPNQAVKVLDRNGKLVEQGRVSKVLAFRGLERVPIEEGNAGDIVSIAGLPQATVAHTICAPEVTEPLPAQPIDPPTLVDDVPRQRFPARRHRGRQGDRADDSRPAAARGGRQRGAAGHRIRREGRHGSGRARRVAARHPDRDHAARGLRAQRVAPARADRVRPRHRRDDGAHRGGRHRSRRGAFRRRGAEAVRTQGRAGRDAAVRRRAAAARLPCADPRPARLSGRAFDRHPRHRHHEPAVPRLCAPTRARSRAAATAC